MAAGAHFSATYREARQKFLKAARCVGATVESHCHPHSHGPEGEELAVDVAMLGDANSGRVLAIVSGTHGVEGYAGSACQCSLLESNLMPELAAVSCLVLVHAINPYGFAYLRRTNEENVDLNRNFVNFSAPLPKNEQYLEYARSFLPNAGALEDYLMARARLEQEANARGGYQFLKKALQPGQYEFAHGLYYGGSAPAWSNGVFRQICQRTFAGARCAALLDIHTGLGPPGVGEVIFLSTAAAEKYQQLVTPPVSCAGSGRSVSAKVVGSLVSAASDHMPAETAMCCALEFGTVSLRENVEATILENWAHQYCAADDSLRQESSKRFKDAYYRDDPLWQDSVINRSHEVVSCLQTFLLSQGV